MSTSEIPRVETMSADFVPVLCDSRWDRFEAFLGRLSERLNPILVKEARQALRSRQFTVTFLLLLVAGWIWSIFGLAAYGPGVYYAAAGPTMFFGYFLILAFPLLIVAPYSIFHSLSSERQDRTYELVSITSLNARHIVSGKLGGISLQMLVYLSAIFPCLAFTYLLRGLDIFTILFVVLYTCGESLGLAVLGLLLASSTAPRQRQIVMSVGFAIVLVFTFFFASTIAFQMVMFDFTRLDSEDFWIGQLALLSLYANAFAIGFLCARSNLMSVCQNRSTDVRIALVVAQLSGLAWMAWAQLRWGSDFVYGFLFVCTFFWYFAGMLLTGESGLLSPRVKRDLPQSTLGRVFLTWFVPGPGTGYMFVIANMLAATIMVSLPYASIRSLFEIATVRVLSTGPAARAVRPELVSTAVIATSYLMIYLGIGKLLMSVIARFSEVRLATRVLVHLLLAMLGAGVPWVIQMTIPELRTEHYTLLQITNPFWTVVELCNKGLPFQMPVLIAVLPIAALVVWSLNVPSLLAELKQVRIPKPERVEEDDKASAPPTVPQRTSPWG